MPTLIITEKPNVAERIAKSLGKSDKKNYKGVSYFEVGDFFVAPAVGHIFGLREKKNNGWVYPVFDIEWVPSHLISKSSDFTKKYLDSIEWLSKKCTKFINACDYDVEGEVIGYNVIKHGCGENPHSENVFRVKYSTLTKESITKAFDKIEKIDFGLADAGLSRHTLDWYWGINLSRALSNAARRIHYTTLSIGRVQGPTIRLLALRELSIRAFKPEKYWQLEMICEKERIFNAIHVKDKFSNEEDPVKIKEKCKDKAKVTDIVSKKSKQEPPFPFDLTTLQTEAYKHLKIDPRRTLEIAQILYTNALISYPRTSSQQIPEDIDCVKILKQLILQKDYVDSCTEIIDSKKTQPVKGKNDDPAHPAIHPTGELPAKLDKETKSLYDLVVRRFLAGFGSNAIRQSVTVTLDNNGEEFISKGNSTVEPGWHIHYEKYAKFEENELPLLAKNDIVDVKDLIIHAKETKPPKRYTPASIIREMEKHNLGTKATRSQIVDILFKRGYVTGKSLEVTELGLSVVDAMEKYCPDVISERLTKRIEDRMEAIQKGEMNKEEVIELGKKKLLQILKKFKENEQNIGQTLVKSILKSKQKIDAVGKCPKCQNDLTIIRLKFGNKFIGCSNYPDCSNTWPLPKDSIKKSGKCSECDYSTVSVSPKGGKSYKMCVNPDCPTKKSNGEISNPGKCPKCGSPLTVRKSRYGTQFIGCSGYPKCNHIWGLPKDEFLEAGKCEKCGYPKIKYGKVEIVSCVNTGCENSKSPERHIAVEVGKCPKCQKDLLIRKSRYGSFFIGCSGYPKCNHIWGLPKDEYEITGKCEKCGYLKITVKPKDKDIYTICVNTDCEKNKV